MNMNMISSICKIFAAQAVVQLFLHAQGCSLEQASVMTSGLMVLAPLYSKKVRDMYAEAFPFQA